MAKIISIANHKGGVGKTTTTASLGAVLAKKGKKVLLVDLDAQSNLTSSLLENTPEENIYQSLKTGIELPQLEVKKNLYIAPAGLELAGIELELATAIARERILEGLLQKIESKYDYILLDCPPSLGLITLNALTASQYLLVTMTAEVLPLQGMTMLENILKMVQSRLNKDLQFLGIVLTRYNSRILNKAIEDSIRERYKEKVFKTKIRENIAIAEAPLAHIDILDYKKESNGAKDYTELAKELLKRI